MILGINHLTWNVADIEAAFQFYVDALGFKPVMKSAWSAYFLAGDVWVAVVKGDPRDDERYDHIAFHVEKTAYLDLVAGLVAQGVPQWQDNETEGDSFYFLDPVGQQVRAPLLQSGRKDQGWKSELGRRRHVVCVTADMRQAPSCPRPGWKMREFHSSISGRCLTRSKSTWTQQTVSDAASSPYSPA